MSQDFVYDGTGPDAFFWASFQRRATRRGVLVPTRVGEDPPAPLGRYDGDNEIVLTLPGGIRTSDVRNLSVWCRAFHINFGDLVIPGRRRPAF